MQHYYYNNIQLHLDVTYFIHFIDFINFIIYLVYGLFLLLLTTQSIGLELFKCSISFQDIIELMSLLFYSCHYYVMFLYMGERHCFF